MTNWPLLIPSYTPTSPTTPVFTHGNHPTTTARMGASASQLCPCRQKDNVTTPGGKNVIPWRRKPGAGMNGAPLRAPRIGIISRQSGIDKSLSGEEDRHTGKKIPKFFNHHHHRNNDKNDHPVGATSRLFSHHRHRVDEPATKTSAPDEAQRGDDEDDDARIDDAPRGFITITDDDVGDDDDNDAREKKINGATSQTTTTTTTRQIVAVSDKSRKNVVPTTTTTTTTTTPSPRGRSCDSQITDALQRQQPRDKTATHAIDADFATLSPERLSAETPRKLTERKLSWGNQSDSGRCSVEHGEHHNGSSQSGTEDGVGDDETRLSAHFRAGPPIAAWSASSTAHCGHREMNR